MYIATVPVLPPAPVFQKREPFPDVSPTHWAYPSIERMRQACVFVGYPDGRFGLNEPLTREQAAAVMDKFIQLVKAGSLPLSPAIPSRPEVNMLQTRILGLEMQVQSLQSAISNLYNQAIGSWR